MPTIKLSSTLVYTDSTGAQTLGGSFTRTQAGSNVTEETQDITTSAVALDVGAAITAGTLGFLIVRNLDAVNFVEVATDSGMTKNVSKILAGEVVPIVPKAGQSFFLKADTATVKVKFLAVEA